MNKLTYLYDDGVVFAIDKPAGIHSVRAGESGGPSVADLLLDENPNLKNASRNEDDAGLVHRLDLSTSGVLLGSRERAIWELLYGQILSGETKKSYLALVEGFPPEKFGCTTFIGSPYRRSAKMRVYETEPPAGHRALEGSTDFHRIAVHPERNLTLVEAHASPARRHQIRVHAAHLGFPLAGDSLYGSTGSLADICPDQREFFLHARRVDFTNPRAGERVVVTSPIESLLCWPRELPLVC